MISKLWHTIGGDGFLCFCALVGDVYKNDMEPIAQSSPYVRSLTLVVVTSPSIGSIPSNPRVLLEHSSQCENRERKLLLQAGDPLRKEIYPDM